MLVLGMMSGTSCDGIDVALAEVRGRGLRTKAKLRGFAEFSYPKKTRKLLLHAANANRTRVLSPADVSLLNVLLGELFAEAALKACRKLRVNPKRIALIGSHGHTIFHGPDHERFGGRRIGSTLQLGEAAVIAERTGVTVVSNFRPRDVAAGGQGAPLVPFVDYLLYRHPRRGRAALNIGGIANLTIIPAGAKPEGVVAFDTGPGNMLMDAVAEAATKGRQRFDRNGSLARRGQVLQPALKRLLAHSYFQRRPPKSTGREEFGEAFFRRFLGMTRGARSEDRLRTAAELTVLTISSGLKRVSRSRRGIAELILGGGGARNRFLIERLREELPGMKFLEAGELGVDGSAKEAFAFAVLACQTWHGEVATLPNTTGARRAVILGQITPGGRR